MDQQDKIAHLNELAKEHFNEGNLSAAINAWQQVLEMDAANSDAQRGVTLAQQKMDVSAGEDESPLGGGPFDEAPLAEEAGGPFDSDETMMFSPGAVGADPSVPAAGSFDDDATMMFSPGSEGPPAPEPALDVADSDATMMFNPAEAAAAAAPPPAAAPAEDDDGGATMMFSPADAAAAAASPPAEPDDADATMMFTPGALPEAAPSDEPADADADATMMFTPGAMPPPAAPADPGAPSIDFGLPSEAPAAPDADQTMLTPDDAGGFDVGAPPPPAFEPEAPPPPAFEPEAPPPPALEPEAPAEQTMLSPDGGNDFAPQPPSLEPEAPAESTMLSPDGGSDFAPPPPAPPPPAEPAAGGGDLEDFEMPSGGLEMAGPPDGGFGGLSLPDAPPALGGGSGDTGGGGGFSFDLPPASPTTGEGLAVPAPGGDFAVPDLPSLGPPSPGMGAPPPLAPPPPPSVPDVGEPQASGQFGEVDPGEIDDLAVPTVAAPEEEAELTEEQRRAAEEAKAAEFAQMYGDGPAAAADSGPLTMEAPPSAIPWKLLIPLVLVIAIICAAVGGFLYLTKEPGPEVELPPPKPVKVEVVKTPAEWKAAYEAEVKGLAVALEANDLDAAVSIAGTAHEYAAKAGLEQTTALDELSDTLQFEQAWNAKFELALRSFCIEDYETAAPMFDELVASKPKDVRPVEYVGRIYYNLGVQTLQSLQPGQAVWLFGQAIQRLPTDAQAKELKVFAQTFSASAQLGYEYTSKVDPLQFRKAGCN